MIQIRLKPYKDPDVLILDEATSALGEKEVKWLFEMMHKLTKEQGKGILFISHRMDELRQVADRATIFRDARYVMTFPWGELGDEEIVEHISGKKSAETSLEKPKGKTYFTTLGKTLEEAQAQKDALAAAIEPILK